MKEARLRPLARKDLVENVRYYSERDEAALGERVFDAAVAALRPIEATPGLGSPRLGALAQIPGLRSWQVEGFPLRWFYFERDNFLDVVRLLGERQDVAALLASGSRASNPRRKA